VAVMTKKWRQTASYQRRKAHRRGIGDSGESGGNGGETMLAWRRGGSSRGGFITISK
jgi:hypothetical protein